MWGRLASMVTTTVSVNMGGCFCSFVPPATVRVKVSCVGDQCFFPLVAGVPAVPRPSSHSCTLGLGVSLPTLSLAVLLPTVAVLFVSRLPPPVGHSVVVRPVLVGSVAVPLSPLVRTFPSARCLLHPSLPTRHALLPVVVSFSGLI